MAGSALSLVTVQDMIDAARALLLDKVQPYRYDNDQMVVGLNLALLSCKRLRPEFFGSTRYKGRVPQYDQPSGEEVCVEEQFRPALLFGIASYVLLRDEEDVQDARADTFMKRFEDMLTGITSSPIQGGTPTSTQPRKGAQS
jgi:hypothetical protein